MLISLTGNLFSQSDTCQNKKWSVGIYVGIIFPNLYSTIEPTRNISLELGYKINQRFSLSFNGTYFFIKTYTFSDYEMVGLTRENSKFYEFNIGGQYSLKNSNPRFFIESDIGYYVLKQQLEDAFWEVHNAEDKNMVFRTGIGLDVMTFKNILATMKANYSFMSLLNWFNDYQNHYGLQIGLKYQF